MGLRKTISNDAEKVSDKHLTLISDKNSIMTGTPLTVCKLPC